MTRIDDLDALDREILSHLRRNAREPSAKIAKAVGLDASAVRRRIAKLEQSGVIAGYTMLLNPHGQGDYIEAYVELTFEGDTDVHSILANATELPEVMEAMTIAGDQDALVRLRVENLRHLRETIMKLRRSGNVRGSRTLIVLGRWGAEHAPRSAQA